MKKSFSTIECNQHLELKGRDILLLPLRKSFARMLQLMNSKLDASYVVKTEMSNFFLI